MKKIKNIEKKELLPHGGQVLQEYLVPKKVLLEKKILKSSKFSNYIFCFFQLVNSKSTRF
jgi:hypothetical protein